MATNFTPMNGEIIIYDEDDNHDYKRIKIGNGTDNVNDLDFVVNKEDVIDALETVAASKADKEHTHSFNNLEDRPFYYEESFSEIIPETTISGITNIGSLNLIQNNTYTVIFNDVEYECVFNGNYLGNQRGYYLDDYSNGEPFYITSNGDVFAGSYPFTIKIVGVSTNLKLLDDMFISDNIQRKSFIVRVYDNIASHSMSEIFNVYRTKNNLIYLIEDDTNIYYFYGINNSLAYFTSINRGGYALEISIDDDKNVIKRISDFSPYSVNDDYYKKYEINNLLQNKANASHSHDDLYYTETEVDTLISNLDTQISGAQEIIPITELTNCEGVTISGDSDGDWHHINLTRDFTPTNKIYKLSRDTMFFYTSTTTNKKVLVFNLQPSLGETEYVKFQNLYLADFGNTIMVTLVVESCVLNINFDDNGDYVDYKINMPVNTSSVIEDANALSKSSSYTPSADTDLSTKKYVDNSISALSNTYYTETEIDTKLSAIDNSIANITSGTVVVKEAEHADNADEATHATTAETAAKATQDASGNVITETYQTITDEALETTDKTVVGAINELNELTFVEPPIYDIYENTSFGFTMYYIDIMQLEAKQLYLIPKREDSIAISIICSANDGTIKNIFSGSLAVDLFYLSIKSDSAATLHLQNKAQSFSIDYSNRDTANNIVVKEVYKYLPIISNGYNYTPTVDKDPATKKYVDDSVANIDLSTYETTENAQSKLDEAKTYADSAATQVKNDLLNGAGAAYDTLKELGDLIDVNVDAIEALETVASGKADKVHSHAVADITDFQDVLDEKLLNSQSDWLVNDETDPAFIQNRPFYSEVQPVAIFDEENATFRDFMGDGSMYACNSQMEFEEEVDEFTIVWDGVPYVCSYKNNPMLGEVFGNEAIFNTMSQGQTAFEDTGEPFVLWHDTFLTLSTETQHSVKVLVDKIVDVPIPSKYLGINIRNGEGEYSVVACNPDTNVASGYGSFAEGCYTTASRYGSHAEGWSTTASGDYSHAQGNSTVANREGMNAIGEYNAYEEIPPYTERIYNSTYGAGYDSFFMADSYTFDETTGQYTLIDYETVSAVEIGKYTMVANYSKDGTYHQLAKVVEVNDNGYPIKTVGHIANSTSNTRGEYAHVVGNGTHSTRSNAHTLDWNGNAWFAGNISLAGNSISLKDTVNGFDYIIQMQNGQLTSFCACTSIEITTLPTKTEYAFGETFDPTGMVVTAVCPDGITREVTNYTYPDLYITESGDITISYVEREKTYTATVAVTVATA